MNKQSNATEVVKNYSDSLAYAIGLDVSLHEMEGGWFVVALVVTPMGVVHRTIEVEQLQGAALKTFDKHVEQAKKFAGNLVQFVDYQADISGRNAVLEWEGAR